MAAEFALAVVQETLERLDSCQNGDYSGILLRLEYLNRTIINCGHLPDSIEAGTGSAMACLLSAQRLSVPCTHRANRLLTGRRGRPPFDVSEDQLVFPSIMEKIVGATIADDLNTIPDHVKDNNEFSRGQNKEYLAPLIS